MVLTTLNANVMNMVLEVEEPKRSRSFDKGLSSQ